MPADTAVMEKLVSLAKRRGFVFQSSEIYGGLGSVWDYGPLGVELKKNIKERWWRSMVHERQGIYVNYLNVLQSSRQKIPFGIAQIGKAFRNEITPGNFIFRTREFEQMEMQFFV